MLPYITMLKRKKETFNQHENKRGTDNTKKARK